MGKITFFFLFFFIFWGQLNLESLRAPASTEITKRSCLEIVETFFSKNKQIIDLPITVNENIDFINKIKNKNYLEGEVFWHLDNTVLKALNDQVYKDKEITHGITIFFQQTMMNKIFANQVLASKINAKYFDYKTLRLSFLDLDQEVLGKEMLKTFKKANEDLANYLKEKKLDEALRTAPFLARNFKNWFAQGVGETPDLAGLMARLARSQSQDNFAKLYSYKKSRDLLTLQFKATKKLSMEIDHILSFDPNGFIWSVLDHSGKEIRVLSRDFLDLLRKSDFYSPEGRAVALQKINLFSGASLKENHLGSVTQFLNNLDYFSAGVLQPETLKLDWSLAKKGFVSVDFTKKGAEGLQHVCANLHQAKSIEEMIELSREGFWKVDQTIQEGVANLVTLVSKKYYHSGDDIVLFNEDFYRGNKIIDKIHEMITSPQIATWRVVFYRGRDAEKLGDVAREIGESFLKKYRNELNLNLARSSETEVLTFVEVVFTAEGAAKRVYYRVKNKEIEEMIEEWHQSFGHDVVFIKI